MNWSNDKNKKQGVSVLPTPIDSFALLMQVLEPEFTQSASR